MFVGARVLVKSIKKENSGFFGIVTERLMSDMFTVELDEGKSITAKIGRLSLVDYFQLKTSTVSYDKVKIIKDEMTPQEFFLRPKAVLYDKILLKCAWLWLNGAAFENKLKPIELEVAVNMGAKAKIKNAHMDAGGLYVPKSIKNPKSIIIVNKSVTTIKRVTETVAHEMVHQYNKEIDVPNGDFDLNIDSAHGRKFMRFAPVLQKIGIPLIKYMDTNFDVQVDEQFNKKIKEYYILVYSLGKDEHGRPKKYAAKFSNLTAAINKYQEMRLSPMSAKIYKSTNAELYHAVKNAPKTGGLYRAEPKVIEEILKFSTEE